MTIKLDAITPNAKDCRGRVFSWAGRGVVLGEVIFGASGGEGDERVCFAVDAGSDVCLAGATRFATCHTDLGLPISPYVVEMRGGAVRFLRPQEGLPEAAAVLERRMRDFLCRRPGGDDSFEGLIDALKACPAPSVRPAEIGERVGRALLLLDAAFEQGLSERHRRYTLWQEMRAELNATRASGSGFVEELHFFLLGRESPAPAEKVLTDRRGAAAGRE